MFSVSSEDEVACIAQRGAVLDDIVKQMQKITEYKNAAHVILFAGENDLCSMHPEAIANSLIPSVLKLSKELSSSTQVIMVSATRRRDLEPSHATRRTRSGDGFADTMRDFLCATSNFKILSRQDACLAHAHFEDDLHPNEDGLLHLWKRMCHFTFIQPQLPESGHFNDETSSGGRAAVTEGEATGEAAAEGGEAAAEGGEAAAEGGEAAAEGGEAATEGGGVAPLVLKDEILGKLEHTFVKHDFDKMGRACTVYHCPVPGCDADIYFQDALMVDKKYPRNTRNNHCGTHGKRKCRDAHGLAKKRIRAQTAAMNSGAAIATEGAATEGAATTVTGAATEGAAGAAATTVTGAATEGAAGAAATTVTAAVAAIEQRARRKFQDAMNTIKRLQPANPQLTAMHDAIECARVMREALQEFELTAKMVKELNDVISA